MIRRLLARLLEHLLAAPDFPHRQWADVTHLGLTEDDDA